MITSIWSASATGEWPDGDFADAEATLVDACRTPWFADAVKVIDYWKQHANPDGADADADWLREGRTASISHRLER